MGARYRVITLDLDQNGEINDAHRTADVLDLPVEPTVEQVAEALKACGRMDQGFPPSLLKLDECGMDYYVCKSDGEKVYELRREQGWTT